MMKNCSEMEIHKENLSDSLCKCKSTMNTQYKIAQ